MRKKMEKKLSAFIDKSVAALRSSDLLSGVELITLERRRQMAEEGWTPEHDDTHRKKELALAAISYAEAHANPDEWSAERGLPPHPTADWPWGKKWWKPSADPIRNLVKAGALIAAEIDRLRRADGGREVRVRKMIEGEQ